MAARWLQSLAQLLKVKRRDVAIFLFSLLLAFGIWTLYNINQGYSATLQARVFVKSNLPGYFPTSSEPVTVEARCRATGYDLLRSRRKMRNRVVTIAVEPELFVPEGDDAFSLSSNALGAYVGELFGSEARLESFIAPSYVFRFPKEDYKKVPVIPVSYLTFRSQYMQRGRLRLQPDSVLVYGDPGLLENIERVYTHRIAWSNLSASRQGSVRIEAPRGVRLSETEAAYAIDVTRFVEVRRTLPVTVRNVPAGKNLSIFPSTAEVSFRCVFPLSSDRTSELQLYIDYDDFLHSASGQCVPRADGTPPGVVNWSVQPEIFECVEVGK